MVYYSIAASHGLFNLAASDLAFSVLDEENYRQSLPPSLEHQLTIQRFCGRVCRSIFDSPIGIHGPRALRLDALIDGLEQELTKIKEEANGSLSGKSR